MILRDYQEKTIAEIRQCYASGVRRLVLQQPTGSGKSVVFSYILKGIYDKGRSGLVVVKGRSLVSNASKRLTRDGVPHTVIMSGFTEFEDNKIYVCSIDTLYTRRLKKNLPQADMVIIDEVHMATSKSAAYNWLMESYPESYVLGTTATPWISGGLRHVADKLIYPISMQELVDQGYLVPLRYFAPTEFDCSKIKVVKGEFDDETALVQFEKQSVYGDVVKVFKTKCKGEPTFCFAINVAHAHMIQKYFSEHEINSVVITAETSLNEREFLIEALGRLEIDCIISVGTMTTGVDIPQLKNIILCRPTQSKNLYVQMLGRGTRLCEGKDHAKILDMVGNISRHGFIIDESIASLDGYEPKKKKDKSLIVLPLIKTCKACFTAVKIHVPVCPNCGHTFTKPLELPKEINNDLKELDLDLRSRMKFRAKALLLNAWSLGHKVGIIYVKLKEEFGDEAVRENWQVYRSCKVEYENWEHGTTPAPSPFASARSPFAKKY